MHWQQPSTPRVAACKQIDGSHTAGYHEQWLSGERLLSCRSSMRVLRRYSATAGSQVVCESATVLCGGYTLGREA